ncbi:Ig-like domain-containing protein, partial [Enterovibrio norvegicus]|uniref:Ig-like domain-containing protein n=1 Tax=Enterovibrio norvegicus TaxID=188144 RepID=UPI00037CD99F
NVGAATITDNGENQGDDDRPQLNVSGGGEVSEGDKAYFVVSLTKETENGPVDVKVDGDVTYTLSFGNTDGFTADDISSLSVNGVKLNSDQIKAFFNGGFEVSLEGDVSDFKVNVKTHDDNVFEGDEGLTLVVTEGQFTTNGTASANAVFSDDGVIDGNPGGDDDRPLLNVTGGGEVSEGQDITFTVDLSNKVAGQLTYNFGIDQGDVERGDITGMTINGKALTADDIDAVFAGTYTVAISGGNTNFDVVFNTRDDKRFEGDESFTLNVSANTGITVDGDNRSLVLTGNQDATISDDGVIGGKPGGDDDRPTISISGKTEVNEGDFACYNIAIDGKTDKIAKFTLELEFGQTDINDFNNTRDFKVVFLNDRNIFEEISPDADGNYSVPPGVTQLLAYVTTSADEPNAVFEDDETYSLKVIPLDGISGITANKSDTQETTIKDDGTYSDDDRPTLQVNSLNDADEGNPANFTVFLGNAVKGKVLYTLNLSSQDGFDADDITSITIGGRTITDADVIKAFFDPEKGYPLELSGDRLDFTVIINTKDDAKFEGDENVTLSVKADIVLAEEGNQLSDSAKIIDNDNPPVAKDDYKDTGSIFFESFESQPSSNNVVLDNGKWVVVDGYNGWDITNGLEIQTGNVGGSTASDGNSHAELDSHGSVDTSVTISRTLDAGDGVIEGQLYTLSFDFKPRLNHEDDSDMLFKFGEFTYKINVDSNKNVTVMPEDSEVTIEGPDNNGWYTVSTEYTANSSAEIELSFANNADTTSTKNFGAYIDNIEVDGPQPYWVNNDSGNEIIIPLEHILGNDSDLDGDLLSVWLESGLETLNLVPENAGTISLVTENGEVTGIKFTPDSEFNGSVQIEYKATDGTNLSNTANIHIYVNEVNANDDGDGILFSTSKADGWENLDGNGFFTVKAFKKGEVLNADGSLNTAGELITEDSEHLDNQYGMGVADSARGDGAGDVPYQVEYDHETDQSEALRIDLTNPIKALEFGVARLFAEENGTEVGQYTLYDADGNFIKVQEFSLDSGNSGKFTIISDVAFAYVVFEALPRTKDGDNQTSGDASDFVITEITILSDKFIVEEGSTPDNSDTDTISGSLFDNDSDPEGHAFSITKVDGNELIFTDGIATVDFDEGTLTIWQNGKFTFEAADQGDDLKAGEKQDFDFTYTIQDEKGDTDTATVHIDIIGKDITPIPEPETMVSGFGGDDSINANIEAILKTGGLNRDDEAYTKELFEDAGYVVDSHDERLLNHDSGKYGNFELELENPYDPSTGAYLFGDLGNDNIIGGAGDDIIRGGANGHGTSGTSANGGQGDTLEGGAGADTFLWMKEDLVNLGAVDGYDHITDFIGDFNVNEDKLDLSDLVSVSNGQLDNLTVGYDDKGQLKISIYVNDLENDTDGNVTQHIVLEKVSQGQEGNEGLDPSAVGGVVLNTIINGKEATLTITDEDGAGTTHNPIVEIKLEEHS